MAKTAATGAASSEAGKGGAGKTTIAGGDETAVSKGGNPAGGKQGAAATGDKGGKQKPVVMDDDGADDDEVDDDATDDDADEGDDDAADDDDAQAGKAKGKKKGDQSDDGKGRKGDKSKPGRKDAHEAKAPAKYDLELPDGADHWIDEADLKAFKKDARTRGLTNEQAQDALDQFVTRAADQSERWYQEVADDDTYGGDNLAETERLARLALDRIEPKNTDHGKALRTILRKTGYGNKLEIVRFLAKAGKLMAEDSGGSAGSGSGGGAKDAAERLYGKTTSNDANE
jgi:hypothetical protein